MDTLRAPFVICVALSSLTACGGSDSKGQAAGAGGSAGVADGGAHPMGEPIRPDSTENWVWVPIDGTVCADGTSAGVGVNFTAKSKNLLIFFQGNGVCYDLISCTAFQSELVGMGPNPLDHMWWGDPNTGHLGIFDRTDPTNPFRKDNFIVFPHCGVDGHTADKDSTYPPLRAVHQHGYVNVTTALHRIVPTFRDAARIVVAGFSAGGIGSGANYHQIAQAFAAVGQPPPFLIDDAGPVLRPPYLGPTGQAALRTGWGLDKTMGLWCPTCATDGYHNVMKTIAELHPGARISVIASYADGIATGLYALLNADVSFNGTKFEAGLRDLASWTDGFDDAIAPSATRVFFYPGSRHGALAVDRLSASPGLTDFLNSQLSGDPAWTTVQQ
jgi:Pectinacetylesterase